MANIGMEVWENDP